MDCFDGIPVHVNELATQRVWKVERLPIKKRRNGYRVRAHQVPAVYQVAGLGLVMHPTLYEQLRRQVMPGFPRKD